MSKVRLHQLAQDGALPGQLIGLVGTEWKPVNPPSGGGGGGGGTGAFFDPFDRADTPLDGNNGWAAATAMATANADTVATFYIEGNLVKQTGFGGYPILHDRQSASTTVADVTCDVTIVAAGATGGIVYAAKPDCSEGMSFLFDGSTGYWEINRYADGRYSGSPSVVTDHGWAGWAVGAPMTIRCVYTEATQTLEVYQNGTLALTIDVSDTNGGFYFGHEVAALSLMTHGGFMSNAGDHSHTFENFSVDGATTVGGGGGTGTVAVLDDLTDVDTTTMAPTDNQALRFDAASGLWLPRDIVTDPAVVTELADHATRITSLEAIPPGALTWPVLAVADIPDPAPYVGYGFIDPDTGYTYVWTGVEWRRWNTTVFVPPLVGDAAIMLPSLYGRYVANGLAYADGAAVAAWPDVSGNANDLIVDSAGTMQVAGIGDLKSVLFDTSTLYRLPAAVPRPVTVFAVMQNNDTAGEGSILFSNTADGTYAYVGILSAAGVRISDGNVTYVDYVGPSLASIVSGPHVIYGRDDVAAGMMVGADGGKATSPATMDFHPQRLGVWNPAPAYSMTGPVSEILVYSAALTDAEVDAITHRLGEVYGITVSV